MYIYTYTKKKKKEKHKLKEIKTTKNKTEYFVNLQYKDRDILLYSILKIEAITKEVASFYIQY